MKKSIFTSFIALLFSVMVYAQQPSAVALPQFSKSEILAFSGLQDLLSAVNKGQDYSNYLVRNFSLTTTVTNADGTQTKLTEIGPGGKWSEKQKALIGKHAAKGAVFTLENIRMIEKGKKGMINQPVVSFSIKE